MIDARRLSLLPKGAFVYNIGRGAIIDEEALVEALRSGHLGGAGLDVFVEEPLPAGHPLWSMENVIITPHLGADTPWDNDPRRRAVCAKPQAFCRRREPNQRGRRRAGILTPPTTGGSPVTQHRHGGIAWDWTPAVWAWSPAEGVGRPRTVYLKDACVDVSTDGVEPAETYEYWRETVFYYFAADRQPRVANPRSDDANAFHRGPTCWFPPGANFAGIARTRSRAPGPGAK